MYNMYICFKSIEFTTHINYNKFAVLQVLIVSGVAGLVYFLPDPNRESNGAGDK